MNLLMNAPDESEKVEESKELDKLEVLQEENTDSDEDEEEMKSLKSLKSPKITKRKIINHQMNQKILMIQDDSDESFGKIESSDSQSGGLINIQYGGV